MAVGRANRILIVLRDFCSGGTQRVAVRLASAWADGGRNVTIVCGSDDGPLRPLLGSAVNVCASPKISRSVFARTRLARAVDQVLRVAKPDILFVPGNYHWPVLLPILGLRTRPLPPVVAKISNPLRRDDRKGLRAAAFEFTVRRIALNVDAFVALSPSLAREARAILKSTRIVSIYEPTLDDNFQRVPRTHSTSKPVVVAAGRLVTQKDFDLAIRGFALVPERQGLELTILGDGPERPRLEALVNHLRLNHRVRFGGFLRDIRPILSEARLFLLTSRFEGYPAVVAEALAAGVPVLATNCSPAIPELLREPEFGTIVYERTAEAIGAAIEDLLDRPTPNPDRLAASVSHNALSASSRAYLDLFDSICAHRVSTSA